ncbi:MAG TPA: hypothetical protein VMJ32_10770 [Pirellulales bacterium]|nr:hypothetical protein [Pirellulales bacterium]
MLIRSTALLCALAAAAIARGDDVRQLSLTKLNPGSRIEISTTDRVYRGELLDPATGETRLAASRDGVQFSQPQTAFLLGATQGRTSEADGLMLVKMNQLQTGLRVELGLGSLQESDRYLTEPVQGLRVEAE